MTTYRRLNPKPGPIPYRDTWAPIPRRTLRCVRCGTAPRDETLYVCAPCHRDPEARREKIAVRDALRMEDPDFGRRWRLRLMAEHGWYGGWDRSTRPERREVAP